MTSARVTPEQVRLEVDVRELGVLDAVAPLTAPPAPGATVRLRVEATKVAVIGGP